MLKQQNCFLILIMHHTAFTEITARQFEIATETLNNQSGTDKA